MTTPMVFVVDDDVSVRESLELLISCAGWRSETFASAREFLEYLTHPRAHVPGTKMVFPGLRDEDDRAALIAYLRTLSDAPAPLAGAQ